LQKNTEKLTEKFG